MDSRGLLVQAAAGERVCVAALQLPFSRTQDEQVKGIPSTVPLPEHRLFGFELASGRPLWNHVPPTGWDGATGPFELRMNVVGPPLVVGERVLVPCTRDDATVDVHVACHALDTGRLLWTSFLARGQSERLNLFGSRIVEFAAAPLAVTPDGTGVIAQTELGRLVALELDTGAIRWTHAYEQRPPPKTKSRGNDVLVSRRRTRAPLVTEGLVLATPRDSAELLVLDLATGLPRGTLTSERLKELEWYGGPDRARIDHLVGALGNRIFLGGEKLLALDRLGGPDSPRVAWTRRIGRSDTARAQLVGERLFLADGQDLHELDPRDGTTLRSYPVGDIASFLVTDDALFALGNDSLARFAR